MMLTIFFFFDILRFDSYFLLDYLYQQDIRPELVMRGSKILCMKAESIGVRVIDSLSYMQMSLRVSVELVGGGGFHYVITL